MWRSLPAPADEVEGTGDIDEAFIQLGDGEDWPEHFGAARLGMLVLHQAGLIDYCRGRMKILDRAGLEMTACECYALITDEYERSTGARLRPGIADLRPDTGDAVSPS